MVLSGLHLTTQEMGEPQNDPSFVFFRYFISGHDMCCAVNGRLEGQMPPLWLACRMVR